MCVVVVSYQEYSLAHAGPACQCHPADEPGVAQYDLKRKFFNKFAKSLPRARKGGPTQVDYKLIRIITERRETHEERMKKTP